MFENHCQQEEGKSVPCLEEGGGDHSTSTVEEKSINSNEDGTVEEKSINSNKDGATPISIVTVEMKQDIEKQANPNGHCWKWPYTDYQVGRLYLHLAYFYRLILGHVRIMLGHVHIAGKFLKFLNRMCMKTNLICNVFE